jgi:hypothetical protein
MPTNLTPPSTDPVQRLWDYVRALEKRIRDLETGKAGR